MSQGIVVEHKESGVRYAISEANFNEAKHKKIRDLRPGESVRAYVPKTKTASGDAETSGGGDEASEGSEVQGDPTGGSSDPKKTPKPRASATPKQ